MNKTFIPASDYNRRKWYVIDCKDQHLGRLASSIIAILSGKIKSYYHPSLDLGDYVILINAELITLDNKIQRFHVFKPGRPGRSLKKIVNFLPQQIIENSVKCMMANGLTKRHLTERLKIYSGPKHPHQAQNPIQIDPNQFEFASFNNNI